MGTKLGEKREYFPKVREAREAIREKALDWLLKYETIIDLAIAKGDLDVAAEHTRWVIEHMPNEEGDRMIDSSAAKPKEVQGGPQGPTIQIGIALGTKPRELPPVTIDAEVIKNE